MLIPSRVKDTTTTAGSGATVTLDNAPPAAHRAFNATKPDGSAVVPLNVLYPYTMASRSLNEFEEGWGRRTGATTFERVTVLDGTNGTSRVNFSAGVKDIFIADHGSYHGTVFAADSAAMASIGSDLSAVKIAAIGADGVPKLTTVASLLAGIGTDVSTLPSATGAPGTDYLIGYRSDGTGAYQLPFSYIGAAAADTTAPTLSSPTGAQTGTTTASGSVTTNEPNGTLYYLATVNATETVATVKASGASKAVTATGSQSVTVSGLTASTQYYLHFVQRDAAGNDSARVTSSAFTTAAVADTTAPTLSSPTGTQTGSTTANLSVSTNEANGTLYRYVSTNAVESAATVKAANLTQAVTATGVQNATASGLTANTQYFAHFVHRDASGNDSLVASSAGFTTASAGDTIAPTLSSPTGTKTGTTTASGTVSTNEANGTLYRLASTSATATAAAVKAGSSQAVTATGVQNVTFSGLTAGTQYYAHYLQADSAGNESAVVASAAFTTDAAAAPAYVARTTVTPDGAAISGTLWTATAGTWAGSSTDKYAAQASGPRVQIINSNTGFAPSAVKFVWGKSPTVAPTGVTYATVDLPIGATDNDAVHLASQGGVNTSGHYGGWTDGGGTAQAYYGVFNVSAGFYAWQAAARVTSHLRYLWIFPDDGSAPFVYDNGTGSAIGWQVNV